MTQQPDPRLVSISRRAVLSGLAAAGAFGLAPSAVQASPGKISPGVDNVPWASESRRPVHDWSEGNLPWAYQSSTDWERRIPTGIPVVDLSTTGSTFWDQLNNTQAAQPGRFICRLGEGDHELTRFRIAGSGSDPTYAFGAFFPKLAGFVGAGPDRTFLTMAANSYTREQLNHLATKTVASFSPLSTAIARIDGSQSDPAYLGGLTVRAADQQSVWPMSQDLNIVQPQPAPHQGIMLYNHGAPLYATVSHVRFQGAGRACNSQPPFEMANMTMGRGYATIYNSEFDGRRSPVLDPAQPRRCAPVMVNGEFYSHFVDCWFHHSNISRYAANDQNVRHGGEYRVTRCKLEQITNNQNRDSVLNNGKTLGGYTDATPLGWESTNAEIHITNCIINQDNPQANVQVPMHIQLTSVGTRNPRGGRIHVTGTTANNAGFPSVHGFIGFRISQSTYWWQDGFDTTVFVHHPKSGHRLAPHVVTGTWPPTGSSLAQAGISPRSHYLVRST